MLQVKDGVLLLAFLIFSRRIDHRMTPGLLCIAVVIDAAHLTSRNALLRTIIITLLTLRNLDATSLAVASEEGLCGWIYEADAIHLHKVVVETHGQRIGDSHESTFAVGLHIILLIAHIHNDLTSLWSLDAEISATLFIHLGEFIAWHSGLSDEGVFRHLNSLGHIDMRTSGLIPKETCHGLAVAAT